MHQRELNDATQHWLTKKKTCLASTSVHYHIDLAVEAFREQHALRHHQVDQLECLVHQEHFLSGPGWERVARFWANLYRILFLETHLDSVFFFTQVICSSDTYSC